MHLQKLLAPVAASVMCMLFGLAIVMVPPAVFGEDHFLSGPARFFEWLMAGYSSTTHLFVLLLFIFCVCNGCRALHVAMDEGRSRIIFPWDPEFGRRLKARREAIEAQFKERQRLEAETAANERGTRDDEPLVMGKPGPLETNHRNRFHSAV